MKGHLLHCLLAERLICLPSVQVIRQEQETRITAHSKPPLDIQTLCSGFTDAFAVLSFGRDSTKCLVLPTFFRDHCFQQVVGSD